MRTTTYSTTSNVHFQVVGGTPSARTEARRKKRKTSTAQVVMPLVMILVLCISIIIKTPKPLTRFRDRGLACKTSACRDYAKLLNTSLDTSTKPCENFYNFVCGQWKKRYETYAREILFKQFVDTLLNVSQLAPSHRPGQSASQKAGAFLRSCVDIIVTDRNQVPYLRRLLEQAGIYWPRRSETPDVLYSMIYLATAWQWPSFFWFSFFGESLQISPSLNLASVFIRRKDALKVNRYREYFNILHRNFALNNANAITYTQLTNIEDKIIPTLENASSPSADDEVNSAETTLQDLSTFTRGVESMRWVNALKNHFPAGKENVIVIRGLKFFTAVFTLLEKLGEPDMHIFLGWCIVQHLALFANRELVVNYYGSQEQAFGAYKEVCIDITNELLGVSMYANFVTRTYTPLLRRGIESIVRNVKKAFSASLSNGTLFRGWEGYLYSGSHLGNALKVIDRIQDPELDFLYANYSDMRDDFVPNWERSLRGRRVTDPTAIKGLSHWNLNEMHLYEFEDEGFEFRLNPHAVLRPLYDPDFLDGINYGGFGSIVSVASSFLLTHDALQDNVSKEFSDQVRCVLGADTLHSLSLEHFEILTRRVSIGSLWTAFKDVSEHDRLYVDSLPEYTNDRLFFIAYCYILCGETGSEHVCNVPLRHFGPFSDTFNCRENSFMRPSETCTLV